MIMQSRGRDKTGGKNNLRRGTGVDGGWTWGHTATLHRSITASNSDV